MEFCPKCSAMLIGKACNRCDYISEKEIKLVTSESIETKKEIVFVNEGDNEVHPIVEKECEKCKNTEAYFWTKQTRASDEAETRFFKCVKCKHTWREYR